VIKKSIAYISLCLFLGACNESVLFQEEKEIANSIWTYQDTVNIEFNIADTSKLYNMYLTMEHQDTFATQNIYLKLYTLFPNGKRMSRIRSFDLFDIKGEPTGKCSGHQCEAKLLLQENAYFNQTGKHVLTLAQNTRQDALGNIRKVGLLIEKTDKVKP
jgi:gliding motility-associated lipoprotein GldH